MSRFLTVLTLFLAVAGFSYNAGEIIRGGRYMASDHTFWAAGQWPVLTFVVGVLYGATIMDWLADYPWAALLATFFLGHLVWPR